MRLLIICLLISFASSAQPLQDSLYDFAAYSPAAMRMAPQETEKKIRVKAAVPKWRVTRNHYLSGGLIFLAGASKGFNETLMFHWKEFHRQFPKAPASWFNPSVSWKNKYKNNDSNAGPKFPLSTSVLVMFTDQYHLNNFINKAAWTSALVIKIADGKKPFKHYVKDFIFYSLCHQAGFALTYYPFNDYRGK